MKSSRNRQTCMQNCCKSVSMSRHAQTLRLGDSLMAALGNKESIHCHLTKIINPRQLSQACLLFSKATRPHQARFRHLPHHLQCERMNV